jgi:hemerythrin superfamily protein
MAKSLKKNGAIALLKHDHREVNRLFKEFRKRDGEGDDAIEAIIATACSELEIHDRIETEIFYPAVRQQAEREKVGGLLNEAEVEHTTVRDLIRKIRQMGAGDEKRTAHFSVLVEYVKHHVKEEEKELFPKVKKLDLDLQALAEQMKQRRADLMGEMGVTVDAIEESADEAA